MFHSHSAFLSFTKRAKRTLIVLFLLVLTVSVAKAQQTTTSVTDGSTPSGLAPGSPAGSYALSGFDNVNLYNGNLNFHLPLIQIGGRGSAQMASTLALNVKSWHISHFHKEMPDGNTIDSFKPTQLGWSPYSGLGAGSLTGRNYGLQTSSNLSCTWYVKTLSRITFSLPGGSEYELRDQQTNGQPLVSTCNQGANRGKVFVTADGTAATFISDTDIIDNPAINVAGPHGFTVSGYLMLSDGARYRIDGGSVTWIRDRNGNTLRFAYTSSSMTITDALNRTVTVNYNVSDPTYGLCDQIVYTGFGGAQRIIRVTRTSLQNVLRSGYTIKTLGNTGGLFPELTGGSPGTTYNPSDMVSAVWLPDGRSYKFYYNSYGELARVELPTGGAVEYDMTPDSGVICYGGCSDPEADRQIYRRVIERRVYPDGSTGNAYELKDVYTNSEAIGTNSSTITVETTASNSTVVSRARHYFDGSALNSLFIGSTSGYGPWYEGHERQTDQLDTTGTIETATVLHRVVNTWAQQAHISWWTGYGPQSEEAPNNPRLIETVTTIEPSGANLVSKTTAVDPNDPTGQTVGFDQFNNPTDVWEYDLGNVFVRRSHTDYVTSSSYINANVDPAIGAHLRSLPSQRWISSDISGLNRVHLTQYEYDVYSNDARHKPLTNRTSITGLCLTFDAAGTCTKLSDSSYTTRGNVTGTTVYTDASAVTGPVTQSAQYDIAGNVTAQLDALGNQTTLGYADSFCNGSTCGGTFTANTYAFPTSKTSPVPDPTGLHGSATAFTSSIVCDYWTGQPTSTTDANNQTTNMQYNDALDRISAVIRPTGGGRTDYEYGDTIGNLFLRTRTDLDSSRKIDGYQFFDGFGRATETRLYEANGQYIATKQISFTTLQDPDTGTWLRASQTSNPYRPTLNEQPAWTTTFFDGLGRAIKVRTPDNAIVRTSFSGNAVTVTDPSGKQRRTLADAAGQIVRIDEPDKDTGDLGPVGTPVQPTSYDYDLMGNLLHVTQGTQPQRSFSYNSLSRLISAFNPESGTVSYQYDANGNLKQKTDARSITIFYEYDNLSRNISINYSNTVIGNPDSPDIENFYDGAINGKGKSWKSYAGGNETAGSNVERTTIDQYDNLGRPTAESQKFKVNGTWSTNTYQVSRGFNLGGSVTLLTYPSGRSVTYNYDDAGRLGDNGQNLAFSGTLGDGIPRTYSRGIMYAPVGKITQEQFGTNAAVYNKLAYNSRLQLAEILVSTTVGNTWDRGKILNQYSLQCSGAGCNATDNNGNLRKQEIYIPDEQGATSASWSQQYDYDQLNRLKRVHEYTGNAALDWQQEFDYDRWGNRTINASNTWIGSSSNPPSSLLNEAQFDTGNLASTNRLYAPGDLALSDNQRRMRYHAAGNLIFDSYSGAGDRVYDAENRITQAWGGNNQWQYYTYNADGRRTRRKIDNQETWQVYGFGGELLAEYPADGAPATPQKEYGYRNGQMLVEAETGSLNAAAPSALTATPPTGSTNLTLSWTTAQGAVKYRVERKAAGGSFTSIGTTTSTSMTDNSAVTGNAYLYQVCSADAAGNCTSSYSNIALGTAITFTDPTIISFADDPSGATVTTLKAVHITELRTAVNAVRTLAGLPNATWTWNVAIGELVHVEDVRDLRTALATALTALQINQTPYIDPTLVGLAEDPVNATYIKADHIRQLRQRATSGTGVAAGSGSVFSLNWVITDHLNTPRIVIDLSGSLSGARRFDYLPFGEMLNSSNGLRSTTNGYAPSSADHIRQKFTQKERDAETGLDYFEARYFSSVQGRFTSPDPYNVVFERETAAQKNPQKAEQQFIKYVSQPQNWNRYTYVNNGPLNATDPTGEVIYLTGTPEEQARALERIKELLGPDRFKYVTVTTYCDAKAGDVTVLSYDSKATHLGIERVGNTAGEKAFSVHMADILESKKVVEYRIAREFDARDGHHSTAEFGGAATLGANESLTGNIQIWVSPVGSSIAENRLNSWAMANRWTGSDHIDFFDDIVDAHEFGHAHEGLTGDPNSESGKRKAIDHENTIRERRGLKSRRLID